jgi:hypothetical protein
LLFFGIASFIDDGNDFIDVSGPFGENGIESVLSEIGWDGNSVFPSIDGGERNAKFVGKLFLSEIQLGPIFFYVVGCHGD